MARILDVFPSEHLPTIYCPVCGTPIPMEPEDAQLCEHVLFVYVDEPNEFEFVRGDLKDAAAEAVEAWHKEEYGEPTDRLLEAVGPKTAIGLRLAYFGFACGPVSISVTIGIDFEPERQGETG